MQRRGWVFYGDGCFTGMVMDTATTQPAKTIPDKGIGAGDVISGVLAGLVCGVLAVFVLAWTQGGARATVPPPDNGNDDIQKLHTLGAALHEQVELGNLTDEQVKWLMMKAATALVSKYCNIPIDIGQNQQRILKPIPLVDMALTDDVIAKSGGFTMSSPLPKKLEGWMTATDLGQKLHPTQEAESVGHYIPIIFEEEFGVGTEMRANKIAANRRIASSMAVFEQYKDPESGLVMVPNDKGDCIALYAQNLATGGFNWRNFYSPERSKWLLEKLEEKYAERAQSKNKKPKTVQAQAPFVPVPLPPPFRRDPPDGNGVK